MFIIKTQKCNIKKVQTDAMVFFFLRFANSNGTEQCLVFVQDARLVPVYIWKSANQLEEKHLDKSDEEDRGVEKTRTTCGTFEFNGSSKDCSMHRFVGPKSVIVPTRVVLDLKKKTTMTLLSIKSCSTPPHT